MRFASTGIKTVCTFGLALALAGGALVGCSSSTDDSTTDDSTSTTDASSEDSTNTAGVEVTETEIEMRYLTADDVESSLGSDDYLIIDTRAVADYEDGHIEGAISADMSAAVEGDYDAGIDTMVAALQDATGSDTGEGETLVLVCYSGRSYAQAATDILNALGADMDSVYTLEGGMSSWTGDTVTD